MQVCTSLQSDNHASTPPLSFFTGRMPFLPPNQQCQSTEGNYLSLTALSLLKQCCGRSVCLSVPFTCIKNCAFMVLALFYCVVRPFEGFKRCYDLSTCLSVCLSHSISSETVHLGFQQCFIMSPTHMERSIQHAPTDSSFNISPCHER